MTRTLATPTDSRRASICSPHIGCLYESAHSSHTLIRRNCKTRYRFERRVSDWLLALRGSPA